MPSWLTLAENIASSLRSLTLCLFSFLHSPITSVSEIRVDSLIITLHFISMAHVIGSCDVLLPSFHSWEGLNHLNSDSLLRFASCHSLPRTSIIPILTSSRKTRFCLLFDSIELRLDAIILILLSIYSSCIAFARALRVLVIAFDRGL